MEINGNTVLFQTDINFIAQETIIESSFETEPVENAHSSASKKRKSKFEESCEIKKKKYAMLQGCNSKCRKECSKVFDENTRASINSSFWSLTFSESRLWLDSYILISDVKTRTTIEVEPTRSCSLKYSLPNAEKKLAAFC